MIKFAFNAFFIISLLIINEKKINLTCIISIMSIYIVAAGVYNWWFTHCYPHLVVKERWYMDGKVIGPYIRKQLAIVHIEIIMRNKIHRSDLK